jgi:ribose 1,5-bisphosphokinase
LSWSAHGLKYGLPSSVDGAMASGRVLVANLSRGAVPSLRARYANVVTVHVTARPETLVERLAGRGRESAADIRERVARSKAAAPPAAGAVLLENDGPPEAAGERLVAVIHEAIGRLRRQIRGAGRMVPPK